MGCELPRVTRCCFCFTLRTGALIIGYLSIVGALLSVSVTSVSIFYVFNYTANHINNPPPGHTSDDVRSNALTLYIILSFSLFVYLFYLVISLLLVIGAHQNKPKFMKYYFMAGMVSLVLNLAVVIVSFIFTGFYTTVLRLISCLLTFYFLLVIRSAYLAMEEEAKPRVQEMKVYNTQQAPLME